MGAHRLTLPVLVVCVLACVLGFTVSPAFSFQTHLFEGSFGADGTSSSTFSGGRPGVLGIDQATGNIYVGDAFLDETVHKFSSEHEPEPFTGLAPNISEGKLGGFGISFWQLAVDSTSPTHVLYVASGPPVRAYQPDGEPADFTAGPGAGTNELPGSGVCGVAVDSSGDIYVSEFSTRVRVFAASGEPLTTIAASDLCNVAVDSHGTVYANALGSPEQGQSGPVEKFTPSAPPPVSASTTYEAAGTVDPNPSLTLTVNPSTDHLYIDEGHQIAEYDESGIRLGAFGATRPGALPSQEGFGVGLAVNGASGRVYVGPGDFGGGQVEVFGPAILLPDVTTGKASEIRPKGTATLSGTLNPDGIALTECQFEYVDAAHYEPSANNPYGAGASTPCVPAVGAIPTSGETEVHAEVASLSPGSTYHFRLRASNANNAKGHSGEDETFVIPPRPSIDAASASNLTASSVDLSVDLNAQINPGGMETTYHFEYDTTPYGSGEGEHAHGTSVGSGVILTGTNDVTLTPVHVTGLSLNKAYYWRVVATNEAGTITGVDHTFVYDTNGENLPDNRAYEMVTPPHKNAALILDRRDFSEDGSRVIMTSIQCFADAESCTGIIQPLLFSRTSSGWVTRALAPPTTQFERNDNWMFSAETGMALFSMSTPPFSEDDFYARKSDGSFVDIGSPTPPSAGPQGVPWSSNVLKATSDFSRVVIQEARAWPFDESTDTKGLSLYELSGAKDTPPVLVDVTGGAGSASLISRCGAVLGSGGNAINPGVMSADGETVYFTADMCPEGGTGVNDETHVPVNELYARIGGSRTVAISEPSAFAPAAPYMSCSEEPCVKDVNEQANWGDALFAGASNDGSKAFFTSAQQLTDSANQNGGNLYEYDIDGPPGENLIDVSAGDTSGHGPEVQGVTAISTDGSHVYFVATGVLSTTANRQGEAARVGANNLYVFERDAEHPHGHIAFVVQLPDADIEQWRHNDEAGHANVTPDGRFLVFESYGRLTPDATGTHGGSQVFRYEAQTGELVRVSIGEHGFNDNGNAGVGDAKIVPESSYWEQASGPARSDPTMSHDGSYVFFESPTGLTPHALNDVQIGSHLEGGPLYAENVYEWHEGQVYLISDGRDTNLFGLGASAVSLFSSDATGSNVFFRTADALVVQDTDTQVDTYDARVCTKSDPCVSQPPQPLPPCLGEACHGTPAAQVLPPSGSTLTLNGQGNVSGPSVKTVKASKGKRVVKCVKGKRRVRGRCVKAKTKRGKTSKAKSHKRGK